MCAYNGLNGTYSCADPVSLGKWLHEELNFQGWVLSDFGSVYENTEIASANSGLDSVIGGTTRAYGQEGEDRLPSKLLSMSPSTF
jgi:beta-glucosidase-like glycosyl hydrolase